VDNVGGFVGLGFQVGLNVSFGMAFLASSFVVFLIKERETKSKHLQFVSGVNFPVFWLAHFVFDAINYLIPAIALIIVLLAFDTEDFNTVETLGNTFVLFLFYGFAIIPLMYLFSFYFTVPSSGFTRMVLFNLFTGTTRQHYI
jgi:ATP-binding cassette subfamily A (ABC1) protein 3